MMSPGYSVRSRDRYSTYSQNENTMSRVLNCCRRSPLIQVSTSTFAGSSSPTTMHGPSEHDWSKFFAMPNLSGPWGSRRAANAPVAQQGHTPDQIPALVRSDILCLLAENDRDLAFVVESVRPARIRYLRIRAGGVSIDLPEAPDSGCP